MNVQGKKLNSVFGCYRQVIVMLILGITTLTNSFAQVSQPYRYERKQKGSDEYFTLIPLKEEGLALLRHKEKYSSSKRVWEIILLDTALQEKRVTEFEVENRYTLVGHEYMRGDIYLLYRTGDTNRNSLELINFNTQGEEKARYAIKPELDFKLTHFIKVGANMVLGGYVSNEPVILIYELQTNLIKVVPGFFQKDNELVDLRGNQNQTFNTVLIDRSTRSEKKFIFRTFDHGGELLLEDVVPIEDNKSLQSSITTTLEREDLLVMGTWGARQSKQALGLFTLTIDPFSEQKINYFDFGRLSHFLDYMKPNRANHIRDVAEHDFKTGRNPSFSNYAMPFKIEEHTDAFLLLAEVYNPVSTASPFTGPYGSPMYGGMYPYYYNPYGPGYYYPSRMYRPYNYNNYNGNSKAADEIKTTQNVLLAVDAKGNVLWDEGMKIDDVNRNALEQVSDFYYDKGRLVFMYKNKSSELKLKFIEVDNNESTDATIKLQTNNPLDEIRSEREEEGGLSRWIGNTFYVWGYQTIRNINNTDDRVRDVFYINKVVVR